MIVIGYQGIGKSTLSNNDLRFIDLESSNFYINGKRADDWYKAYCNIAEHLSKQGYIVFTSSHKPVRDTLKDSTEKVIVCCPSLELKDQWIKRLQDRYNNTKLEKDYKALMNAKTEYENNIKDILNSGIDNVILTNINYDLASILINKEANIDRINYDFEEI